MPIIAICLREDFPEHLRAGTALAPIERVTWAIQDLSAAFSPIEAARACHHFVLVPARIPVFEARGYHRVLVGAFPAFPVDARTCALSAFGNCFLSECL